MLSTISRFVADRYRVGKQLGQGSFGVVHSAYDEKRNIKVAIKISYFEINNKYLQNEYKIYKMLCRGPGIPKCFWFGKHEDYSILVMELMGKSLEEHFVMCNNSFSLKTILMLADQIITIIEFLHKRRCLLHRDIKPENFLTGLASKKNQVFLIDYGLSKSYCNPSTKEHIDFKRDRKTITGTLRYLSLNGTQGEQLSRRDDLESVAYMLIYFLRGKLPWQGLPYNKQCRTSQILSMKKNISAKELVGSHPEEFATFLMYTRNLGFKETPDYGYIKLLLKNLFLSCNYVEDMEFDWSSDFVGDSHESSFSSLNLSTSSSIVV